MKNTINIDDDNHELGQINDFTLQGSASSTKEDEEVFLKGYLKTAHQKCGWGPRQLVILSRLIEKKNA